MIRKYTGVKYSYEVEFNRFQDKYLFSITAIHKQSRRYSCINSLNQILSDFSIGTRNNDATEWTVASDELELLKKKLKTYLVQSYSRDYLETRLDEDRSCGEWEKIKQGKIKKSK